MEMKEFKFHDEEQVQDQTPELDDELEIEIVDDTSEEDRKNAIKEIGPRYSFERR